MTTAVGMITRAMRLAGVINKGETLDSDEAADGLACLNSMLPSWSTERLFIYQVVESTFNLVAGSEAYTIGSGGNFNVSRPDRLEDSCFILLSDVIYPVKILDEEDFSILQTVGQSQMPQSLYYDPSVPLGTVYFDYSPDIAYEFHLKRWQPLQVFASLTDELVLPRGYERAIVYSLAEEFGPEFRAVIPPMVSGIAQKARANLKRMNLKVPVLRTEMGQARSNILTG